MNNQNLTQHDDLESILFPVEIRDTSDHFTSDNFANDLQKCVYLPDQNKVVQFCGQSYQLVHNREIILPVYEKMIDVFGRGGFSIEVRSYDDRRFYARFIIDDSLHTVIAGDKVCPEIVIRNSYDGSIKQTVGVGYVRQICANGLMAFTSEVSVSAKHSKRYGVVDLKPIFEKLDSLEVKLEQFKRLTERRVTPDELTKITHAIRTNNSIKYPKKMITPAQLIAEKEAMQLKTPLNAWLVYNGFNNPLNHFETKLLPEEATRIDRRVLRTIEKTLALN